MFFFGLKLRLTSLVSQTTALYLAQCRLTHTERERHGETETERQRQRDRERQRKILPERFVSSPLLLHTANRQKLSPVVVVVVVVFCCFFGGGGGGEVVFNTVYCLTRTTENRPDPSTVARYYDANSK